MTKPLAAKIDQKPTEDLLAEYGQVGFSKEKLEREIAILAELRQKKAAFKDANAAIFEQEKALNDAERDSRRRAYALLASAAQNLPEDEFEAVKQALPDGAGYTPRYEVRGDELEIWKWCLVYGQGYLVVNRGLFDAHVKATAEMAGYTQRPMLAPPAELTECILPTLSDKIGKSAEEKPKKGKKGDSDTLPDNTDEIMS